MITVLLADDQAMFRRALATYLELTREFEVVAEASSAAEALSGIRSTRPDVALLDVQMPGDGLEAALAAHRIRPATRIIMCTTFDRPGYVARAVEAGCFGFVTKDADPDTLVDVIRRVGAGERVFDERMVDEARTWGSSPLTAREREVLIASADGVSVKELAHRLFLSNGTVRNHLSAAIGKTGATSRAQAVDLARQNGWL